MPTAAEEQEILERLRAEALKQLTEGKSRQEVRNRLRAIGLKAELIDELCAAEQAPAIQPDVEDLKTALQDLDDFLLVIPERLSTQADRYKLSQDLIAWHNRIRGVLDGR